MPSSELHEYLTEAPLHQILEAVTTSVLQTQEALNQQSLAIAARLAGATPEDQVTFGTRKYSLLELGFVPEFCQLGETEVQLKMAMQLQPGDGHPQVYGSLLNERNLCGFGFAAEGASVITARLVPTNAAPVFEKRIGKMVSELTDAAFQRIRAYVVAQNADDMTLYELEQTGVDALDVNNLADYRARLIALHPDELPHIASLTQIIQRVNGFITVRAYVEANDTRPMTIDELHATGVLGVLDRNLAHYRQRLMMLSTLSDVDALQVVVDQSNSFARIISAVQVKQLVNVSTELLNAAGMLRVNDARLADYQTALGLLTQEALKTYHHANLQQLIDSVNG